MHDYEVSVCFGFLRSVLPIMTEEDRLSVGLLAITFLSDKQTPDDEQALKLICKKFNMRRH